MQATSYVDGIAQSRSAEFDAAAIATDREVKAKLTIQWTDPYVDTSVEETTTDENYRTVTEHIIDTVTNTPHKYAILDGTFLLDGTYHPAPCTDAEKDANQMGWYSGSVCDGSGDFSPTYPAIEVEFTDRTLYAISVVGEPTLNQYPVEFDLYAYDDEDAELFHEVVTGNDEVRYEISMPGGELLEVVKIKLVIKKWSAVDTVVKITEFFTNDIIDFFSEDIVSMDLLEEREIRDGSLPVGNISCNELHLSLQNVSIVHNGEDLEDPFSYGNDDSYLQTFLRPNRRVTAYLGFKLPDDTIEYVLIGTFWTGEWQLKQDDFSVSVTCRDRMELLRRAEFISEEFFTDTTLYDAAVYVLEHARDNIPLKDLTWEIDTELQNFTIPYIWFEKDNYMATLRHIAEACIGQVYMSKNDVLIIDSYTKNSPDSVDLEITTDNYFTKDQPANNDDMANYIEVETQILLPSEEPTTVHESASAISIGSLETQTDIEIHYNEAPVEDAEAEIVDETGGVDVTITGEPTYYPWGVIITVENGNAVAGTYKFKIDGIVYSYKGSEIIIAQDATSIFENGKLLYKYPANYLVQSSAVAQTIADELLASYKEPRKDLAINWRGNPALELGDVVETLEYIKDEDSDADFIGFRNQLRFDGTLKCMTNARKVEIA